METVLPGLRASAPQPLPFGSGIEARAFLLEREGERGDLLIYSAGDLGSQLAAEGGRDRIARQYLNHQHEAEVAPDGLVAPLVVHVEARGPVSQHAPVADSFTERHLVDDDFEVIPTPGHTGGSTCFLWTSGDGRRLLFTGDTLFLSHGEWAVAVLESSDRDAYLESLELMLDLDFDVLVPWVATSDGPPIAHTDRADAQRRIRALIERVGEGAGS